MRFGETFVERMPCRLKAMGKREWLADGAALDRVQAANGQPRDFIEKIELLEELAVSQPAPRTD